MPGVDLERLRFTAELTEDPRARTATFQADLPVDGVRLVKAFAVSKEGYEVVLTVRLVGANAAAFMAGRRLDLELGAGRDLFPPAAPGFAAMLDRVHRVLVGPTACAPSTTRAERLLRSGWGNGAEFAAASGPSSSRPTAPARFSRDLAKASPSPPRPSRGA